MGRICAAAGDLERLFARIAANFAARPLLVDAALAAGLTLLSLLTVAGGAGDIGSAGGLAFVLLLLETAPLVLRRIFPIPVWLVTLGATVGHFLVSTGSPSSIRATLGALIALFTVSERYERRKSIWAMLVTLVLVAALIVERAGFPAGLGALVQLSVATVVPWVLGVWSRERRSFADLAEARAVAAERDREAEARRAVADERDRIARELHDVVAHNLSVIVIQAGAGLRAFDSQPDESRGTLRAIEATAREALGEMRRMLSLVGPADSGSELAPLPGLANLDALADRVRTAGLEVELTVDGEAAPLNPAVELSAYRIVQEALTNALRHSGASRAVVRVHRGHASVEVEVVDEGGVDGPRPAVEPPHVGRGILGMRERAALFGGELQAGPLPSGGFRVAARIPLPT